MAIFKRKKQAEQQQTSAKVTIEHKKPKEEAFVSKISLYEFEKVNWSEFGSLLKQKRILPNSYNKKPTSVDVKLNQENEPMVLLTFNSATSDSVREFLLMQNDVFQSVNGSVLDNKSEDLATVWNDFRNKIKYRNEINTNQENYVNRAKARKLIEKANKMMAYDDIYQLEQTFLEKYKDANFDVFCWVNSYCNGSYNTSPAFIPLDKTEDGGYKSGDPAVPFSPRTLEHCILHMTNGEKIDHGEYVDDFEKMCRKIQEYSCFESNDWDKVIEIGKNIVKTAYQADVLEKGF